jgi:hypothetical protein
MHAKTSYFTIVGALALALGFAVSCSTTADPPDPEVPACDCPIGERKLDCATAAYWISDDSFVQHTPSSNAYLCIDEGATEQEKEDECIDGCEAWLGPILLMSRYCDFFDENDPHPFGYCGAPVEETGTMEDFTCPSWYSPSTKVSKYSADSNEATVTILRSFVDDIRAELTSVYACDDGLYEEGSSDWEFDGVSSGDLLYELGVRSGDKNASVQGWDPVNDRTTTAVFDLDSPEAMFDAHRALLGEDGVKLTVERTGASGGDFDIWITLS